MNNGEIPEVLQSPRGDLSRRATRGLRLERIKNTPKIAHQCPSVLEDLRRPNDDHVHSGSTDTDLQDSCRPHNVSNPHRRKSLDEDDRQSETEAHANGNSRSYFGRRLHKEPDIEQGADIDSFRTTAAPSSSLYQIIKDYLLQGPPIPLDYRKTMDDGWTRYEKAIKDLLKDPKCAHWLNGPMFGDGDESQLQQWHGHDRDRDRKRLEHTQWTSRASKWLQFIAMVGEIFFWISHITAALSSVLVMNSSGPKGHSMVDL